MCAAVHLIQLGQIATKKLKLAENNLNSVQRFVPNEILLKKERF